MNKILLIVVLTAGFWMAACTPAAPTAAQNPTEPPNKQLLFLKSPSMPQTFRTRHPSRSAQAGYESN